MAARPRSIPVATRLPPELVEKVDRLAEVMGESRSDAIRKIVEEYEPPVTLDPDAPFFAEPLPARKGARRVSFRETRAKYLAGRRP